MHLLKMFPIPAEQPVLIAEVPVIRVQGCVPSALRSLRWPPSALTVATVTFLGSFLRTYSRRYSFVLVWIRLWAQKSPSLNSKNVIWHLDVV